MIDVTNGTNVDVRLRTLVGSICTVSINELCGVLLLKSRLNRANAVARRPQEGGQRSESGGHSETENLNK